MSDTAWGSLAASDEDGQEVIAKSYGLSSTDPAPFGHRFTIARDGTVFALVAGDMGYGATHITIPREHIIALVEDWPEFNQS